MFANRTEAGRRLAAAMRHLADRTPIVYALPRGGVPVAVEVAESLEAPLELILVRKIGVPGWQELAIGAIVDGKTPVTVLNDAVIRELRVDDDSIRKAETAALAELERRRTAYLADRTPPDAKGRWAIVVDDGIATGATVRAALKGLRRQEPAGIVLAVPVAPDDTLAQLGEEADEVVCLETPRPFTAVGAHYRDFGQISDDDVRAILERHHAGRPKDG